MEDVSLILVIFTLTLFTLSFFIRERKPVQLTMTIVSVMAIGTVIQDEGIAGAPMVVLLILLFYIFLMGIAGAVSQAVGGE